MCFTSMSFIVVLCIFSFTYVYNLCNRDDLITKIATATITYGELGIYPVELFTKCKLISVTYKFCLYNHKITLKS